MYEGSYTKWFMRREAGLIHIELKSADFSRFALVGLIKELMALSERMQTVKEKPPEPRSAGGFWRRL